MIFLCPTKFVRIDWVGLFVCFALSNNALGRHCWRTVDLCQFMTLYRSSAIWKPNRDKISFATSFKQRYIQLLDVYRVESTSFTEKSESFASFYISHWFESYCWFLLAGKPWIFNNSNFKRYFLTFVFLWLIFRYGEWQRWRFEE